MVTSSFAPSAISADLTLAERRRLLRQDMQACRDSTLSLLSDLTTAELRQQSHPAFSPIGWHLGHIAFAESLWLLEHLQDVPCPYPQYRTLFAADGLPKNERENLPDRATLLTFMADIRDRTLSYLDQAPLDDQLRLWRWVLQHESQHAEIATYVLAMHRQTDSAAIAPTVTPPVEAPFATMTFEATGTRNMVLIPAGHTTLGDETLDALDNERPGDTVCTPAYWLDQTPVTVGAYRRFMAAGGYTNRQWWHPQGWQWVQAHNVRAPLYYSDDPAQDEAPVCGVSWYEADAYACFVGKRLPTEAEWERAARWHPQSQAVRTMPWGETLPTAEHGNFGGQRGGVTAVGQFPAGRSATGCDDLLGNVWEWTSSWFDGYPGFVPYPYVGYSQAYFDQAHRVLKGGSWATRPWILRPAFRNWYEPHVRQPFAGFRCALAA